MRKKNIKKVALFAPAVVLTVLGLKDPNNINTNINNLKNFFNDDVIEDNNYIYNERNYNINDSGIYNESENTFYQEHGNNNIVQLDEEIMNNQNIFNSDDSKYIDGSNQSTIEANIIPDEQVMQILNQYSVSNSNNNTGNYEQVQTNIMADNSVEIKFSNADLNEFNYYLMQNRTNFSFEKYYSFDEAFKLYNAVDNNYEHDIELKNITVDELYDIVLKNNEQYHKNNSVWMYNDLSNNEIKKICEIIVPTVNDYLSGNHGIDTEQVKCTLSHLAIFKSGTSLSYAYISNDYCMIVNPDIIGVAFSNLSYDDTYKVTIQHEVMHLLQKPCPCELEKNSNIDRSVSFSKFFNNIDVNPLYFSWLAESSAEMNKMDYSNVPALSYKTMIGYMQSITMPNLIRNDFSMNSMYDLSFSQDINDLYKFFDVKTTEDKLEVLNLIYTIEIFQQTPTDFLNKYKKVNGIESMTQDDIDEQIRYIAKADACESISRFFYRNLANELGKHNISLNDIFYLIKSHETDLNYHISFNDPEKYKYNKDLMQNYVNLQNEFFSIIAKQLNVSVDDIYDMYDNYQPYIKNESGELVKNYNLSWMREVKQRFLKDKLDVQETYYTDSLINFYNMYQNDNTFGY